MAETKKIIETFIFSLILLGIMFLVPFTIGLSKGGFNDDKIFNNFIFYMVAGSAGFLMVIASFVIELFNKNGDDKYGNSIGFYNIGDKPGLSYFKRFTGFQLILLSLMIFMTVFLVINIGGYFVSSFTGLKVLPQEFTATDSLLFSSAQIPIAENFVLAGVIALSLVLLRLLARKFNWDSKEFFFIIIILIPLISGLFGMAWHSTVYSSSEVALITVFFFWTVGGFLIVLTGFYGIFWIMHLTNNFFIDTSRWLSSDLIIMIVAGIIIALGVLYAWLYRGRLLGRE